MIKIVLENPKSLWLLLLLPGLVYYAIISFQRANFWLYQFARKNKNIFNYATFIICLSFSLVSLVFALANPKAQYIRTVFSRSGINIAIGIDVSKSMLAEDEMLPKDEEKIFPIPNRLNRARACALNILGNLRGERVGVFMFASRGVEVIPLTGDYGYCRYLLKHINDASITLPGSDLKEAILTGLSMLEDAAPRQVRVIIIISDGEDITDNPEGLLEAANLSRSKGVPIYTVGVGKARSVFIPIRNYTRETIVDYYQDEEGNYLKTRLDQDKLQTIANMTRGIYYRVNEPQCEEKIISSILEHSQKVEYVKTKEAAWFHFSFILLFISWVSFGIAIILSQR